MNLLKSKKQTKYVVRNKRLLIDQPAAIKMIQSIHVPDQLQTKPSHGIIVAVSPDLADSYKIGDVCHFFKDAGFEVNMDAKDFRLIHELEVYLTNEPD